ncbi:hypothetical protein KAR91_04025 [Candidatus Pacearchaeota archaeon]|nr:hypothetical protein [Candidatus Pacearchaeota archaeon]
MDYSRFSEDEPMIAAICEECYAFCTCGGQTDEDFDTGLCPRRCAKITKKIEINSNGRI